MVGGLGSRYQSSLESSGFAWQGVGSPGLQDYWVRCSIPAQRR